MTTRHVTDAVLYVIKSAGYSVGETTTVNHDGTTRCVAMGLSRRGPDLLA